ncbi:MAG: biotin--[acetyl-CoA-carboxylase] ligase [Bacilli bacterium]|nr:biotin--[acetyl-CoA-carboxylase] ligase [Bacilli bacterium]
MSYHSIHLDEVGSTNAYLLESYENFDSFTFLSASYQSQGKGRGSHVWESPKGSNLLCSLLLKEEPLLDLGGFLSLIAGVIIARRIESFGVNDVAIKWPNDIYVKGKKICGILLQANLPHALVIGFGINVNQQDFPLIYAHAPTSLSLELGKVVDVMELKKMLCEDFDAALHADIDKSQYLSYFRSHDYLLGKKIELMGQVGIASSVNDDFALLLQNEQGTFALSSGEVHFL